MCGFDNDWACPNYSDEITGKPHWCTAGGCALDCCAREHADNLSRLTGSEVSRFEVHKG